MKLSGLIAHTAVKLQLAEANVKTIARVLQPMGLITNPGRNPQGVLMTAADGAALFLSVCSLGTANRAAAEFQKWIERCPGLIEHIESCIKNPPTDTSVEFDVDGYCARFIRNGKIRTFGTRSDVASYLTRTITARAFFGWLTGLTA